MHALEEHVGCHEHFFCAEIHDGTIVSDGFLRRRLDRFEVFCQMFDESELTVFRDFSHSHFGIRQTWRIHINTHNEHAKVRKIIQN